MADLSIGVIGAGRMGSCHAVNVHRYVKEARVLVSDACIQSLHSGTTVAVSTPARPGFYQGRESQGGAHVN